MSNKSKNYTDEFKIQIVKIVRSGKSASSVANEYGVAKSTVTKWVRDYNNSGSFRAKDNRTPKENELIKLKKQVKELEMEVDILTSSAYKAARKVIFRNLEGSATFRKVENDILQKI